MLTASQPQALHRVQLRQLSPEMWETCRDYRPTCFCIISVMRHTQFG